MTTPPQHTDEGRPDGTLDPPATEGGRRRAAAAALRAVAEAERRRRREAATRDSLEREDARPRGG